MPSWMLVTGVVAFLLAFGLTWGLIPLLSRHVLDRPNERSSHVTPVPRAGGLAVLLGLTVAAGGAAFWRDVDVPWVTAVALLVFAAVGLVDDLRSLGVRVRLCVQVAAAFVAVIGLAQGNEQWWWIPFGAFLVVGFVNSFNFMDGINGISSATALVGGLWYAWLLADHSEWALAAAAVSLAGAAAGFGVLNVAGKVFLGDVGSYFIGALLMTLGLAAWNLGTPFLVAMAPLVLYVAETGWAVAQRVAQGETVGEPHRGHVYQRLVDGGSKHLSVSLLVAGVTVLVCVVALLLDERWWLTAPALLVVFAAYASLPHLRSPRPDRPLSRTDAA